MLAAPRFAADVPWLAPATTSALLILPKATPTAEGVGIWARNSGSSDLGADFGEPAEALSLLAVGPTFSEALEFFLEVEDSALAGVLASVSPF